MENLNMEETIQNLKESPLFNLSLSSRELFHSNFLYWLANNYSSKFGALFASYLKAQPDDFTIDEIYREKKNIDLSFTYSNGQEVLIENKVKSIPYIGQLEMYSQNNTDNQNYILLSLSKPAFFEGQDTMIIGNVEWHYISYTKLKNMLCKLQGGIENEYHAQIITDYCVFINGLVEINTLCGLENDDTFDFHSNKHDALYNYLEDIRLHDFYLKRKYELLAYKVYKELKSRGKNMTPFSAPLDWKNAREKTIYMNYGMTRSQGLMDLKYFISKKVLLGIQIQGDQYRMVIEDNDNKTANKLKDKLNSEENKLWFGFTSFPDGFESIKKVYPQQKGKVFNKFGKNFFYKSVKLGTDLKIKEIIDVILLDVEKIESNFEEMRK